MTNYSIDFKETLINKLNKKTAKIGVVGIGYVGLPLALTYSDSGYKVIGFDINKNRVEEINSGKSPINHINNNRIYSNLEKGRFQATTKFSRVNETDAIIICVPTPLNIHREPDLSFIHATLDSITAYLKKGQVLSLESTTYPGTTQEVFAPVINQNGFILGQDYFLVYSPEREDPGNKIYSTSNIPKVVGGHTKSCQQIGKALYEQIIKEIVLVSSTQTAEMTKLLENIHRAVNIGLMNELKLLAERMNIDLYEVIRAASTKPFGYVPYYPGPGLGGHCIPIDPFYLTWKAREFGMHTKFIELAGEINSKMPEYVIERTVEALNEKKKSIKGSKIMVLGLAYKKNVDDMRESPSVEILDLLLKKGAQVSYSDPFFPAFPPCRKLEINMQSTEIKSNTLCKYDAVILATDHDEFDYESILNDSKILIDTRGRFGKSDKVFRA